MFKCKICTYTWYIKKKKVSIGVKSYMVRIAYTHAPQSYNVIGVRAKVQLSRTRITLQERVRSNFGPFFTCPVRAADGVYIPCYIALR